MSDDLPIYSETPLRTGLQFAELERLKGPDTLPVWTEADARIAALEGLSSPSNVAAARETLITFTKEAGGGKQTSRLSIGDRIVHPLNS